MNDKKILQHITDLMDEEHKLRSEIASSNHSNAERLKHVEEELDQCWDLLRQRRAKREFGDNEDGADIRDVKTVEGYIG
jgi:septation ring formation regulator EzrA